MDEWKLIDCPSCKYLSSPCACCGGSGKMYAMKAQEYVKYDCCCGDEDCERNRDGWEIVTRLVRDIPS